MNIGLFLNLLLAHLVGDCVLQSDALCKKKREKGLKSWFMWMHPAIRQEGRQRPEERRGTDQLLVILVVVFEGIDGFPDFTMDVVATGIVN